MSNKLYSSLFSTPTAIIKYAECHFTYARDSLCAYIAANSAVQNLKDDIRVQRCPAASPTSFSE